MSQAESKTYQCAHILVQHQYEAEDLLKRIAEGETFEKLAQKYSLCPSSENGGELGSLKKGQADQDFEEVALALKPQEITKRAVRTRFGYHIIKRL